MILFFAVIGMVACGVGISIVAMLSYGIIKMWGLTE